MLDLFLFDNSGDLLYDLSETFENFEVGKSEVVVKMLSSLLSALSPLNNKDSSFNNSSKKKSTSPRSSGGFRRHSRFARFSANDSDSADDDEEKRDESFKSVLRLCALYTSLKDLFRAQCASRKWYRCIKHGGVLTEHLWVNAVPISLRHRWWIHASGAAEMMTNRDKQKHDWRGLKVNDRSNMETLVDITDVSVFGGSCNLTSEIERDVSTRNTHSRYSTSITKSLKFNLHFVRSKYR